MAYFTSAFLEFFKGLEANNNSAWFNENKKTYEAEVKKPFEELVADLISRVSAVDPRIALTPKEAIFRINRDIRFAKDKSPYKTQAAALISPGGRKNKTTPGYYVAIGTGGPLVYGGVYFADPDQLLRVRKHIAADPAKFKSLYGDRVFKDIYGEIRGEKGKVLPAELKAAAEAEPLLYNKQFFYGVDLPVSLVTSDKLADEMVRCFDAARPMNKYLAEALG